MAKIRIDTAALDCGAKALDIRISDYRNCLSQLDGIISQITDTWEGQASQAYIAKMLVERQNFEKIIEILQEFINYANRANYDFGNLDDASAQRIRASF